MKIIQESPEHHFLGFIEKIRSDASGWVGMHFALSGKINHFDLTDQPKTIKKNLDKIQVEGQALLAKAQAKIDVFGNAILYGFSDGDVVILMRPRNEAEQATSKELFETLAGQAGKSLSRYSHLAKDSHTYQKLAEQRLLAAKRVEAYRAMADAHKVGSLALRRKKRTEPFVLLVEDDRFTAACAIDILNKQYKFSYVSSGEEAIISYIEHAPDIVLLDIHLPGLNGHETLHALKKIDPDAYVIMVSVDTMKTNIVSASKSGAAGFLKKPFAKDRLLAAIQKSPFIK
ncbi:MAG: response regulator [Rhodospirillales bacterium]|nr:response regulator [Rhodospirillales bacterium]